MSASFFTSQKDAVLDAGAANFSTRISATPLAFNLTADDASQFAALYATWNSAYTAVNTIGARSKSLVQAKNDARTPLKQMASALAKIIDSSPSVTDTQKVLLGISVRATPTPVGVLGTPNRFTGNLAVDGSLEIGWKCTNPRGASGTTYQVYRQIGATGAPVSVGATGIKKFVDYTIPAGATSVMYQVQAIRSTGSGAWAQFNVTFGSGNSTMSIEETPMKVAA